MAKILGQNAIFPLITFVKLDVGVMREGERDGGRVTLLLCLILLKINGLGATELRKQQQQQQQQ